jgi:hypothetical protein
VRRAYAELRLAEVDGAALAKAIRRPVVVTAEDAPHRSIVIARDLLSKQAGFVDSRAFPVFVARALRHLAGQDPLSPYAAAGEATDRGGRLEAPDGALLDPVDVPFVPSAVGDYTSRDDLRVLHASLLPSQLTSEERGNAEAASVPSGGWPLASWIVLLAFALLLAEWFLVRTGRVP